MSVPRYSRRAVAIGAGMAAALGIGALSVTVPRLLRRHYRASPYDDLFAQLTDRDAAMRVGRAILASGIPFKAKAMARDLRQRFERRNIGEVTDADVAQGKLIEVQGWVLPESLALLCALAADEG